MLVEGAAARTDLKLEVLDLRTTSCRSSTSRCRRPIRAASTRNRRPGLAKRIGEFDAFLATVAELQSRSHGGAEERLRQRPARMQRKPIAFVGYGGVGAARAIEQPAGRGYRVADGADHARGEYRDGAIPRHRPKGAKLNDYDIWCKRKAMFDHLVWWGKVLKQRGRWRARKRPRGLTRRASTQPRETDLERDDRFRFLDESQSGSCLRRAGSRPPARCTRELYMADAKLFEPDNVFTAETRSAVPWMRSSLVCRPIRIYPGWNCRRSSRPWTAILAGRSAGRSAAVTGTDVAQIEAGGSSPCTFSRSRTALSAFAPLYPAQRKEHP